jgi:uncharacterized coiled-coil protein SlyX
MSRILTTHEAFAARAALNKIRLPELQARKAMQEEKIEGLILALHEARQRERTFRRTAFTQESLYSTLEARRNMPACDDLENAISAAFERRAEIVSELQAASP